MPTSKLGSLYVTELKRLLTLIAICVGGIAIGLLGFSFPGNKLAQLLNAASTESAFLSQVVQYDLLVINCFLSLLKFNLLNLHCSEGGSFCYLCRCFSGFSSACFTCRALKGFYTRKKRHIWDLDRSWVLFYCLICLQLNSLISQVLPTKAWKIFSNRTISLQCKSWRI